MTEIQIPHVNAWKIERHPPLEWLVLLNHKIEGDSRREQIW